MTLLYIKIYFCTLNIYTNKLDRDKVFHYEEVSSKEHITHIDINNSFHYIVLWLFQRNSYFHKVWEAFFGKKMYALLLHYLETQSIEKKHYSFLKKQLSLKSFSDFFESLDIKELNTTSQEQKKFRSETLALLTEELDIYFTVALIRFKIFEDILQADFQEHYKVIWAGKDFKVFQNSKEESYFLELEGKIYPEIELFWKQEREYYTLTHTIFSGNNHTYVYAYRSRELREFEGEYIETHTVHDQDYICIEAEKKTIIYCLDDGYEVEENVLLQDIVELAEDTLIIASHRITEGQWEKKIPYVDIFSKHQATQVREIEGKLLEIKKSWNSVTLLIEQSEVQIGDTGYEVLYFHAYYYFHEDESFEKEERKNLKLRYLDRRVRYGRNALTKNSPSIAYTQMKTELYTTKNDTLAFISFFPAGPERDTPFYNIISFTGKIRIYSIVKIKKIEVHSGIVEVWYYDTSEQECYFNSDYSYTLLPKQQPEVHKHDMH